MLGDDRRDTVVQQREQRVRDEWPVPTAPERERARPQEHHGPDDLTLDRLPPPRARRPARSTGAPIPAACERTNAVCSAARRSGGIVTVASAPNPVDTP